MLNFKMILKIFSDSLNDSITAPESAEELSNLISLNFKTNKKLWELEDLARMDELGPVHVATAKKEIDKNNQIRNDLIRKIDIKVSDQIGVLPGPQKQLYCESPGMIIDRIAILFIKLTVVRNLLMVIKEANLREEYSVKEKTILMQIDHIGNFLDYYFDKLARKEVFFEIQQPIKIYNDKRIKEYIKILKKKGTQRKNSI